jgi:hypothetical protein
MQKFTVIDIRQELAVAQTAASIVVNNEVIGKGSSDNIVFNVATSDLEKALVDNPGLELMAAPLDVIHVCCLEKDSQKLATGLFQLTECPIIATIKAKDWVRYLNRVSTLLLGTYLVSAIAKAQTDLKDLPKDYLKNKYGVETFDEVAKLLVDSNLGSTYSNLVSRMFSTSAAIQSYKPMYNKPNPGGVSVVNIDSQKIKSALNSLISEKADRNYTTEEDTVILVVNPNMVLVKASNLFSSIYARDEANGAIKVDNLLAQLFSECEEPAVITSCFSCPKVLGNCYESLAREHNLVDNSELLNPFRNLTVNAQLLIDKERKASSKPLLNAFGKQVTTSPAVWNALQRHVTTTGIMSENLVKEVINNVITSLTTLGFTYIKPSRCVPADELLSNAFRSVDVMEVDLSDSSIESNSLHWKSLSDNRKLATEFRKEYCDNCMLKNPCLEANNGKINARCREFLPDTAGSKDRLSGKHLINSESEIVAELEKSIDSKIKYIESEYKNNATIYKSIFYLPGSRIYLTKYNGWVCDHILVTDITHEDLLLKSGATFQRLVSNTLDRVETYVDGKSMGYHFAEGARNPLNKRSKETIDKEYNFLSRYEFAWYAKNSPIGLNNILVPRNKNTSGWLVRLSMARSSQYGNSVYKSLYVDLDVALASVLTPLGSIGQGKCMSDSGYIAVSGNSNNISGVDTSRYLGRYFNSDKATDEIPKNSNPSSLKIQYWFLEDGFTADSIVNKSMLDSLAALKKPVIDKKCLSKYLYITANAGLLSYFDSKTAGFGNSSEVAQTYNTVVKIYPGIGLVSSSAVENRSNLATSNISDLVDCSRIEISYTTDSKVVTKRADNVSSMFNQSMSWVLRDAMTAWNFGSHHTSMGTIKLTQPASSLVDSIISTCYTGANGIAPNDRNIRDTLTNNSGYSKSDSHNVPVSVTLNGYENFANSSTLITKVVEDKADDKFSTDNCHILFESYKSNKPKKYGSRIKIMHLDCVGGKIKYVPVTPITTYVDTTANVFRNSKEVESLCHKLSNDSYKTIIDNILAQVRVSCGIESTTSDSVLVLRNMIQSSVPGDPVSAYSVITRTGGNSNTLNLAYGKMYESGKVRVKLSAYRLPVCAVIYNENGDIVDKILSKSGTSAASYMPDSKSLNIPLSITEKERWGYIKNYSKFLGTVFMPTMDSVRINVAMSRKFIKLAYDRDRIITSTRYNILNKCVNMISGAHV